MQNNNNMDIEKVEKSVKQFYKIIIKSQPGVHLKTNLLDLDSFNFEHMGRYVEGKGRSINISEVFNMPKFDKTNLSNAKIYRFPKLTLPRDKMETIHKKYGSRVIRDKDKADLAVISEKYLESLIQYNWSNVTYNSVEGLRNIILNKNFLSTVEYNRIDKLLLDFESQEDEYCFNISYQYYYGNNVNQPLRNFMDSLTKSNNSYGSCGYIPFANESTFSWLIDNQKLLCWDHELSKTSTEDSVTLTEETYNSVNNMVKSKDLENVTMGMEMMANCNSDKSFTYLALLFFHHFENMKICKNWNYVNFKSLKERFSNYISGSNINYTWPYDRFIKNLIKDDALTEFAVQVITKNMFDTVLQRSFGGAGESVFNIDPSLLVLKEQYSKKIRKEDLELDDVPFF